VVESVVKLSNEFVDVDIVDSFIDLNSSVLKLFKIKKFNFD